MVGLFTGLAVIAAGAVTVYFITSSLGPQLFRKKSVSTILKNVKARQSTTPSTFSFRENSRPNSTGSASTVPRRAGLSAASWNGNFSNAPQSRKDGESWA